MDMDMALPVQTYLGLIFGLVPIYDRGRYYRFKPCTASTSSDLSSIQKRNHRHLAFAFIMSTWRWRWWWRLDWLDAPELFGFSFWMTRKEEGESMDLDHKRQHFSSQNSSSFWKFVIGDEMRWDNRTNWRKPETEPEPTWKLETYTSYN